MKDYSKIKELYEKLKSNRITEAELDEFFSLVNRKEGHSLSDAEMKKLWDLNLTVPMDAEMSKRIRELKELAGSGRKQNRGKLISLNRQNLRWIGGIAASIIVLVTLLFASGILLGDIEYHTGFGEREKITLPDGSVVELNANTTLVWDKKWSKNNVRLLTLEGEAFFEVRHTDDHQKFVVRTNDLNVEVVGTSFNVSSRHNNTEVYLEEGSVRLDLKGTSQEEVTMMPGQKISYSRENEILKESKAQHPETTASWKDNVLYFDNKTVGEILREVSELYGVQFEYGDPEIRERRLNFWVPYSDWETTKEAFELTMKLRIQENEGVYVIGKK